MRLPPFVGCTIVWPRHIERLANICHHLKSFSKNVLWPSEAVRYHLFENATGRRRSQNTHVSGFSDEQWSRNISRLRAVYHDNTGLRQSERDAFKLYFADGRGMDDKLKSFVFLY